MDVSRLGCGFTELLSEPRKVHIDGFVGASVRLVPYLCQELALADHATGSFEEVDQQFELARREFERLTTKRDLLAVEVGRYLSHGHRSLLRVRSRSAKDRSEASLEVFRRVRLHDVVVGTRVEQSYDLRLIVSSRGNNHRNVGDRTNHSECFCAVEVWKAKVEHNYIKTSRHRSLYTGHGSSDGIDLVTPLGESTRQRLPDALIVFDDEDGGHRTTIPNSHGAERT